jgi:hypothetical protein
MGSFSVGRDEGKQGLGSRPPRRAAVGLVRQAVLASQILARGGGKLAIRKRASCDGLRANTGSWRMGMNPGKGIPETAFFASWRHGVMA